MKFTSKPLVVLDIDETLLHASTFDLDKKLDYKAERTWVYKRPFVDQFLDFCGFHFRVGIWTTARESFASEIFTEVLVPSYPIEFIRTVEHCTRIKNLKDDRLTYIKDLRQLKDMDYPQEHIIMIDDTEEKLQFTPDNLIHVSSFYGDPNDDELLQLMPYLLILSKEKNIGWVEKTRWKSAISLTGRQ